MNIPSIFPTTRTRFPSVLLDRITLADGRCVIVRPMVAIDAPAEQDFVRGLSMETRRKRFHVALQELSPDLLRQLTDVDHVGHVAIVAESLSDEDEGDDEATIVADARYVSEHGETHLAITVADAWQGVGLGRALLQRLLRYAARRGVERLVADMLRDNTAMARLAVACGGQLGPSPLERGLRRAIFLFPRVSAPDPIPSSTLRIPSAPCRPTPASASCGLR